MPKCLCVRTAELGCFQQDLRGKKATEFREFGAD
jgi:hypothetical protein